MKYSKNIKPATKKTAYYKFSEVADRTDCIPVEEAMLWLKKGNYASTGVTVKYAPEEAISDWARVIKLENVELAFEKSDDGKYTNLVIRGTGDIPF